MSKRKDKTSVGEVNEENRLKLEALADEDEDRHQREVAESRNLVEVDELINYASTTKRLVLPSIGGYVTYRPLRIEDRAEIMRVKDKDPDVQLDLRNRKTVYLMLKRADDRWTEEKAYNLPAAWVDAMLIEYAKEEQDRFLLPVYRRRFAGLRQTPKPSA